MGGMDDFAAGLVDEVLGEMAENFFGARRRMDRLLEEYARLAGMLRSMEAEVKERARMLHFLFGSAERAALFYEAIGVDPADLPFCLGCATPPQGGKIPFALTLRGRFTRMVERTYEELRLAADGCMHGRHERSAEHPGRMVLTLNHDQLQRFAEGINAAVERMNREMSASCVLRYARDFADPTAAERERVTGAVCGPDGKDGSYGLDQEFAYRPVDWEEEGFARFPDLPPLERVRAPLRRFCREHVHEHGDEARRALAAVKTGAKWQGA
ncbi:MAG: hypothetical protein AB7D51_07545 [Desulfovibrionaceae bacterium]